MFNFDFLIDAIRHNRLLRRKAAEWSHPMFFLLYFSRYITCRTAPFQNEIFSLTANSRHSLFVITAFRGSAKSTICATSLPLWKILSGQAHFVVLTGQTRTQVRQTFGNVRKELEGNELLRNDFGPIEEESDEWGAYAISFKKYDAKIMAVSTEQSIRGLRYKQYRPDLIICDDIEDLASTRTKESRDKIYGWFTSEILPLGTPRTPVYVLGNFLHEYSIVGRLMSQIESGERDGVFRKYPLLDENGACTWPGMYPDDAAIAALKKRIGDESAFAREYLLRLIKILH